MDLRNGIIVTAYTVASALYLAYHLGQKEPIARAARLILVAGWLVHLLDITARCLVGQHPAASTPEAAAFIAWMIAGGYGLASFRYKLHAAGAFAAPAALTLVLLARVLPASPDTPRMGPLGLWHIFLSTVGVATFALAAVLELVYLVQDRRLRRKEFQLLRAGTAPLDTLDRLAARCVSVGFPVFTLAIITGALWVARLGVLHTGGAVRPEYVLAVASWIAFGLLLIARAGAGWQGRRAAWLTVGGFAGVLLVVAGYFLRSIA